MVFRSTNALRSVFYKLHKFKLFGSLRFSNLTLTVQQCSLASFLLFLRLFYVSSHADIFTIKFIRNNGKLKYRGTGSARFLSLKFIWIGSNWLSLIFYFLIQLILDLGPIQKGQLSSGNVATTVSSTAGKSLNRI